MSQTTDNLMAYLSVFWKNVIGNAASIEDKLTQLHNTVERTQNTVKTTYVDAFFASLHIESEGIKAAIQQNRFYQAVKDSTLDTVALRTRFATMEVSDRASVNAFVTEVNNALDELVKNNTDAHLRAIISSTQTTLTSVLDFLYYIAEEERPDIHSRVDALIQVVADWFTVIGRLHPAQTAYLVSMMQRSEAVIALLSPIQQSAAPPPQYNRLEKLKEDLPKVEAKIREGKLPNQEAIKELHLAEFFEAGMSFTEIKSYETMHRITEQIQDSISHFFDLLRKIYVDNPNTIHYLDFIQDQILHWLTLPSDFRPENWVEVIHYVIKNIQYTFDGISHPDFSQIKAIAEPILEKLDAIFSTINNDTFKLLITPKENTAIYNIDLPDILSDEDDEEEEKDEITYKVLSTSPEQIGVSDSNTTTDKANTPKGTPEITLTYSDVIEFLCFDEKCGALAKLDKEKGYDTVIRKLYYRNWVSSLLYVVESDLYDFAEQNKLEKHLEDLKGEIFNEKGFIIGNFVTNLIDKVASVINDLINFVKDTLQYVIDELFKLAKAIIAFFQKVNLPEVALDLLKQLSPFKNMPNEVTLLHVIAAIPYTLYTEFIQFEPQMQAA